MKSLMVDERNVKKKKVEMEWKINFQRFIFIAQLLDKMIEWERKKGRTHKI